MGGHRGMTAGTYIISGRNGKWYFNIPRTFNIIFEDIQ